MKMTALTKHAPGTASFYIRAADEHGMWEECTETPLPFAQLIQVAEDALARLKRHAKAESGVSR